MELFCKHFNSKLTLTEMRFCMQTAVDACSYHASKQADRGLISSLPILYCANSFLKLTYIHGLPKVGGYDSCLMVTYGLTCFTSGFVGNKEITGTYWSNNGSNPTEHPNKCIQLKMCALGVIPDGTNKYSTPRFPQEYRAPTHLTLSVTHKTM